MKLRWLIALGFSCVAVPSYAAEPAASGVPDPSIATSLPSNGDPRGIRASFARRGVTYGAKYVGEILSNLQGGFETGTIYDGQLGLYLDVDLAKFIGWPGLTFHAHGYQIHGEGITETKVGNFNALSTIEALPTTRLLELWFQQELLPGAMSVRFGQMAVDGEFLLVENAGNFVSATFGWPTIAAVNLPNGGSAYPLAASAVRLELAATESVTLRAAVFDDDPAGNCDTNPQICNPYGLEFRITDNPYLIGESEIHFGKSGSDWLPGVLKIGAWFDFGRFDDLRYGVDGLSLAHPSSGGEPRTNRGNYTFYAVVEQQLYQQPGSESGKGVSMFARMMGAPSDHNLVDLYVDGGLVMSGFITGRPDDSFGVAAAYAGVSDQAKGIDQDVLSFGSSALIRADEITLEASYLAQVVPGWTLQPDVQYVWNPSGSLPDAAVVGVRTSLSY